MVRDNTKPDMRGFLFHMNAVRVIVIDGEPWFVALRRTAGIREADHRADAEGRRTLKRHVFRALVAAAAHTGWTDFHFIASNIVVRTAAANRPSWTLFVAYSIREFQIFRTPFRRDGRK